MATFSSSSSEKPLRNRLLSPPSSSLREKATEQGLGSGHGQDESDLDEKYHNLLPSFHTNNMSGKPDTKRNSLSSSTPLIPLPPILTPPSLFKISPRTISDATLGLSDGLTVPFALTAGLAALGSSRVVVFGGLAELTAGSISMGLGGYLGAKAEQEAYNNILQSTRTMIRRYPAHAIQVLRDSLADLSLPTDDLEDNLRSDPNCRQMGFVDANGDADADVDSDLSQKSSDSDLGKGSRIYHTHRIIEDVQRKQLDESRLERLLLRYVHNQCEPPSANRAFISGLTIALAYFCGGFVPLLPYLFVDRVGTAFWWSVGVMVISLALFGAVKTVLLRSEMEEAGANLPWDPETDNGQGKRRWWADGIKDCARGAAQMVLLGGIAAGAAMALVSVFDQGGESGVSQS